MAARFALVSEEEILLMNEVAVPKNTKMATKFGLTVFNGKLFKLSKYNALKKIKVLQCLTYEIFRALKLQCKQSKI